MKKTNIFKVAALTAVFAVAGMFANAQQTTGSVGKVTNEALPGINNGYVKVIDQKGTVKFLQSKNGITMFSDVAPDGGIVTTWQLGGTFDNDVTLNVDDQQFNILGIDSVMTAGAPSYQLLVTDPITGNLRRLAFDGLIKSGVQKFEVTNASTIIYTLSPVVSLPVFSQVYVYRNGAKLLSGEDYILSGTGAFQIQSTITLYVDDVLEIHYIK